MYSVGLTAAQWATVENHWVCENTWYILGWNPEPWVIPPSEVKTIALENSG